MKILLPSDLEERDKLYRLLNPTKLEDYELSVPITILDDDSNIIDVIAEEIMWLS